jgi:hypothetical protein
MTKDQLEGYLFTLDICEKELPLDAHPKHYERLKEIRAILKSMTVKG